MMEENERKVVELTDHEYNVMIKALADRRKDHLAASRDPAEVSDLILRVIDAPEDCTEERSSSKGGR